MADQNQQILLQQPSPDIARSYHDQLIVELKADGVSVSMDAGQGKGKGIFATHSFSKGDTVWTETPLIAEQGLASRRSAHICACCFRFLGSVEHQLAVKLLDVVQQLEQDKAGREDQEPLSRQQLSKIEKLLDQANATLDANTLEDMLTGKMQLPLGEQMQAPLPVHTCRLGCGEKYCSSGCERRAWQQHHCLLCPGPSSDDADRSGAEGASSSTAHGSSGGGGSSSSALPTCPSELPGLSAVHPVLPKRAQLFNLLQHAAETNEVFILASKVVAHTLLGAYAELARGGPAAAAGACEGADPADREAEASRCDAALQAAWTPYSLGFKAVWWESVSVPDDVEEEEEFRTELRDLADASLAHLRAAIFDPRFSGLFSSEVYGSIVGMFELNNLTLTVPTPLEDYFLLVDELPEEEKAAAQAVTQPFLDILDAEYCTPAEGSGFYALQSCANHSCRPNAQVRGPCGHSNSAAWPTQHADTPHRGVGSTMLTHHIEASGRGDEVTVSYIDEGLSYKARRKALLDYGFECCCEKCKVDSTSTKKKGGNVKIGKGK
ncbi:MAG: hypothetical protein WDW36_005534 [Sanguina aurantia]